MHTPADLGGKGFETLLPQGARSALLRLRHRRRNGEVVSRVQSDSLIDDPEVALELFELMAHPVEPTQEGGVVDSFSIGAQEALKSGLDDCRFARASLLGRGFQPLGDL